MSDTTTIRVGKDAKARANEAKRDNETWNDFIQRCTDTPPEIKALVPAEDVTGAGLTRDEVREVVREVIRDELAGAVGR